MNFLEVISFSLNLYDFKNFKCLFPLLREKYTIVRGNNEKFLGLQNTYLIYRISYHSNGNPFGESGLKNNRIHGNFWVWNSKGNLIKHGVQINGKMNGLYTEYYSNGKTKMEGDYLHGEKTGTWTYWDENGNVERIIHWI